MDKRAIYTVITGGYDTLKDPLIKSEGWEYICFTDDPGLTSDTWEIRVINAQEVALDSQRLQRKIKILAHVFLPQYRFTIYLDGSTVQTRDFNKLLQSIQYKGGMALKKHRKRNCVYEEVAACVKLNKDSRVVLIDQMQHYYNSGYPANNGLYESGILIRENCYAVNSICTKWYSELEKYSIRDQVSLPYVMHIWGFKPQVIPYNTVAQYINVQAHCGKSVIKPHIWYLQPYASDKNIGKEYNHQCDLIPENDWICILDHDVMFLHPETKKQIEDIVLTQGNAWDLLGAVTNRIGSLHQCAIGFSDDPDVLSHYSIAKQLHEKQYGAVSLTMKGVAGFLMLMPKKTWSDIKFVENNIAFDTDFSRRLLQKGGKIGVMQGVYVFHYYRFHAPNPKQFKDHLL
jgi:hypothetical protein